MLVHNASEWYVVSKDRAWDAPYKPMLPLLHEVLYQEELVLVSAMFPVYWIKENITVAQRYPAIVLVLSDVQASTKSQRKIR